MLSWVILVVLIMLAVILIAVRLLLRSIDTTPEEKCSYDEYYDKYNVDDYDPESYIYKGWRQRW